MSDNLQKPLDDDTAKEMLYQLTSQGKGINFEGAALVLAGQKPHLLEDAKKRLSDNITMSEGKIKEHASNRPFHSFLGGIFRSQEHKDEINDLEKFKAQLTTLNANGMAEEVFAQAVKDGLIEEPSIFLITKYSSGDEDHGAWVPDAIKKVLDIEGEWHAGQLQPGGFYKGGHTWKLTAEHFATLKEIHKKFEGGEINKDLSKALNSNVKSLEIAEGICHWLSNTEAVEVGADYMGRQWAQQEAFRKATSLTDEEREAFDIAWKVMIKDVQIAAIIHGEKSDEAAAAAKKCKEQVETFLQMVLERVDKERGGRA